jgi:putative ABC transport system permease protein
VAKVLGYQLGDRLVLAHGVAKTSFSLHEDKPFKVVGIFERTGTPVDQTLHVSLAGIEAIHKNWQSASAGAMEMSAQDLTSTSITAFIVGMNSRIQIFRFQRSVNEYRAEPLVAILPGVALTQLWQIMSVMEDSLRLVSALVLLASVMGLSAMLLSSIREREREIAVMRVMGARPWFLFALIQAEALLITLMSIGCALLLLVLATGFAQGWFASQFAVSISGYGLTRESILLIGIVVLSAVVSTIFPAFAAYSAGLHSRLSQ